MKVYGAILEKQTRAIDESLMELNISIKLSLEKPLEKFRGGKKDLYGCLVDLQKAYN